MIRPLIATAMDNRYEWNLLHDFLPTLRQVGYRGEILVLDYGITSQALHRAVAEKGLTALSCPRSGLIVSARFLHLARLLASPEWKHVTHVMAVDSGDVWFQEPFEEVFSLCRDRIGYVEEPDCCHENWMRERIEELRDPALRRWTLSRLTEQRVIGAGMLCGPREQVRLLSRGVERLVKRFGQDFYGVDQIAVNLLLREPDEAELKPGIPLPSTYNYVYVTHLDEAQYVGGKLLDKSGKLVKIAHNSGFDNRPIDRRENR